MANSMDPMDRVITFNKSYQQRLLEYTDVLSGYEVLPASRVKKEWGYYLELSVEPKGWQAIWKINRLKCEELHVSFPTVVLVYVDSVVFAEHAAEVKILAVQDDDVHLPRRHVVPLIQLWPMKEQDRSVYLDLDATANSIDMLRFFYLYVFMPWDLEEDNNVDWLGVHLESRLHLHYDMRNGVIATSTAEYINGLLTEARRLQARREQLSEEVDGVVNLEETSNPLVQKLLDIHVRMVQIQDEVKLLENPLFRKALLQNQQPPPETSAKPEQWLVFDRGTVSSLIAFLNKAKESVPGDFNNISTLALAFESARTDDTVLLSPAVHKFKAVGALQKGGALKGVYGKEDTMITALNEDVMLDCVGDVTLENLTVNAQLPQIAVVARLGTVTLRNCKIVGDRKSSIHQGILVLAGAKVNLIDCDIGGFNTAIVGNSGADVSLKNCTVSGVHIGLKVFDKTRVKLEAVSFRGCKEYGIQVEANTYEDDVYGVGSFAVLQKVDNMTVEGVTGENIGLADAIVTRPTKLEAIRDLFSGPYLDPTVSDDCDEEMEANMSYDSLSEHNETVVENEANQH